MRWGTYRVPRRLVAALALCGVLVHASLLPWHTVSQFLAKVAAHDPMADLTVICHGDRTPSQAGQPGDASPVAPAAPQSHCPICKGLAAFHHAVLAKVELGLPSPASAALEPAARMAAPAGSDRLAPRSRGPPLHVNV